MKTTVNVEGLTIEPHGRFVPNVSIYITFSYHAISTGFSRCFPAVFMLVLLAVLLYYTFAVFFLGGSPLILYLFFHNQWELSEHHVSSLRCSVLIFLVFQQLDLSHQRVMTSSRKAYLLEDLTHIVYSCYRRVEFPTLTVP